MAEIEAALAVLQALMNFSTEVYGVIIPLLKKMEDEGRTELTPEEKQQLRDATDAARQYALDSKPGDPISA